MMSFEKYTQNYLYRYHYNGLGETDFQKTEGIALLDSFVDPLVIHHPEGHTVPNLGLCPY